MTRLTRALNALIAPSPARHMATTATSPRNQGDVGPYRTVNRDTVLTATVAPPGARQQWQLYRVRQTSRDLELRSPDMGRICPRFARIQTLGWEPARLQFDRMTDEQRGAIARGGDPLDSPRMAPLPGRFPASSAPGRRFIKRPVRLCTTLDVDGDCFLTRRLVQSRRVWDLHPGDALEEGQLRVGGMGGTAGNRQLGIEVDGYNRPVAFYFRNNGLLAPLNVEYSSFGRAGGGTRFPADRVVHIRDRSGEITAVRGWPRCTTVVEDIARLDEWYSALVRSATLRAAIGVLLQVDPSMGGAHLTGAGQTMGGIAARSAGAAGLEDGTARTAETVRSYQTFGENAGSMVELYPGFIPHAMPQGSPTAQEAQAIGMLERRVCAALEDHAGHTPRRLRGALVLRRPAWRHSGTAGDPRPANDPREPVLRADLRRLPHGPVGAADGRSPRSHAGGSWRRCSTRPCG